MDAGNDALKHTHICACFSPEGLLSFSSQRNLRAAPARPPASAACLKVSQGRCVSWWTCCSRTRPSSRSSVSLCEQTQAAVAPHRPEQTSLLFLQNPQRAQRAERGRRAQARGGGRDCLCSGSTESRLRTVAVQTFYFLLYVPKWVFSF